MKKLYFSILIYSITQNINGQQNFCDFEGNKFMNFGISTGIIDTLSINPAPDITNSSAYCAKYIRDISTFDVIKMYPFMNLIDVSAYADSSAEAPKMQIKLYTNSPVGTPVQLQLGRKDVNDYPAGVHSEYASVTTVQNAWEIITFYYFQSPAGSLALSTNIDKIVLLFNPNSSGRDTIYFDDLIGPALNTKVSKIDDFPPFKLSQNNPNPAKQNTVISFQIHTQGNVTLELFDMLGNSISRLLNQEMKHGTHAITIETATLPNGIYFYVLKKDGFSQTRRLVVSN